MLIILMVVVTIIDSQFINLFYGSKFGTPSILHLLLFTFLAIVASIININYCYLPEEMIFMLQLVDLYCLRLLMLVHLQFSTQYRVYCLS
jgi:hypothetical protein